MFPSQEKDESDFCKRYKIREFNKYDEVICEINEFAFFKTQTYGNKQSIWYNVTNCIEYHPLKLCLLC